jgi:predicted alpha/beta-fold hydrolase
LDVLDSLVGAARGHLWTIAPLAAWQLRPQPLPPFVRWSVALDDDAVGRVRLSGALHSRQRDALVVAVHGLGGDIDSHYIHRAAIEADLAGADCLRLNLRGADMSGHDFYHAGLAADLHAAVGSAQLARYRRIVVMGYSLGGHIALRYALDNPDPRVVAVAAICPPLDLTRAIEDIDAPVRWPYRQHVLRALKAMVVPIAARRELPLPLAKARAISRLRQWDEQLVVPRFGFRSASDYYRRESVAPRLGDLRLPSLIVTARHDPMVLAGSLEPTLSKCSDAVDIHWLHDAGHVGFPGGAHLGLPGKRGLEAQAVAWLLAHGRL